MSTLESFAAYAADFEKTLHDDDWSRVEPWFAADATYRVESSQFGCDLTGPKDILAGMKKSLDGFDRKFDGRTIEITEGPEADGEEMRVAWKITYRKEGLPPFLLEGRSMARVRDGKIALLVDAYDEEATAAALADWSRETGIELDPTYT